MQLASASVTPRALSRAAQYVRMSTEHQQYSSDNQLEIIRQYAAAHNMEIVQDYSDHGRSGLNIDGRALHPRVVPRPDLLMASQWSHADSRASCGNG
jgi:hypothetical protein